jgi:hypothetical protein
MSKKDKNKNWYTFSNIFIYFIKFNDIILTLWTNRKNGGTKYQVLIWKNNNEVYFKFGKTYGFSSCWETLLPSQKNINPIKLKTN